MPDETKPWRVELCVQIRGENAAVSRELARRIEASVRRIGGEHVSLFSDHEGPQDGLGGDGDGDR